MKVYWHIGPHKTGTTALQIALRDHAASGKCGYYYPAPLAGPGHAELAWRFLGVNSRPKDQDAVLREVQAAQKKGFNKIVLSSEEFSRAVLLDDGLQSWARLCEEFDCELVLTLSPLPHRILPELQELIKHSVSFELYTLADLLRLCDARPGLRPDFLSSAILGIKAASVSVILVDKGQPEKVYRSMSTIIGEDIPIPATSLANQSYPFLKMVWLNYFNRYFPKLSPETSRRVVDAAFNAALSEYGEIEDVRYPPLPDVFVQYVTRVWEMQLKFLEIMQDAGRLRCL